MRLPAARQHDSQRSAPAPRAENGDFFHARSLFLAQAKISALRLAPAARCFRGAGKITSTAIASEPRCTIVGGAKCGAHRKYTSTGMAAAAAIEPSET